MRNQFEPFFLDQVSSHSAHAIGLVLNSQQIILEVTDELFLADSQLYVRFF